MSKQWLEETENLLHSIEQERQVVAIEHEKLGRELAAKDEEIAHWQAVLDSYTKRQTVEISQPDLFPLELDSYSKLSHRQIVFAIRDRNEGFIPMKQVAEILKQKVATPSHAAPVAYGVIGRLLKQGKVTKVRPGLYRWVNGA